MVSRREARLHSRVVSTAHGTVTLRPPATGDGPALLALMQGVLAEGRWFFSYPDELAPDEHALEARLLRLDAQDNGHVRLAVADRQVVGLASIRGGQPRRLRHVGHLEVRVAATHRGRGIGRALVASLLQQAADGPVLRKVSLAVFADNAPAIALYRSLGFAEEGRRVGEYREDDGRLRDDLLMARWVKPLG